MSAELLIQQHGTILVITFNRPEVLNAVTPSMERAYFDALAAADHDSGVRAIVVTGAGRGFCAGADISVPPRELAAHGAPLPSRSRTSYPPLLRTPLIAAVNGSCAGVGLAMALQADVRIVSTTAKLTTAFTRRGLIAEHGTSWLLPELVGRGRAMDLLLSARVFSGRDALDWGLAQFCVPEQEVLDAALAYAEDLAANCSPASMALVKRQMRSDVLLEPYAALLASDDATRESFTWPDLVEGIESWQEGRAARFGPLVAGATHT